MTQPTTYYEDWQLDIIDTAWGLFKLTLVGLGWFVPIYWSLLHASM